MEQTTSGAQVRASPMLLGWFPFAFRSFPHLGLVLASCLCLLGMPAPFRWAQKVFLTLPSPRWLMTKDRYEESLAVISSIRSLPSDNELVQLEYLEMKAQHRFEVETSAARFPQYQGPGLMNQFKLGFQQYVSLLTNRSLFKRVVVAVFIMVFQQCGFLTKQLWRTWLLMLSFYRVRSQRHPLLCSCNFPHSSKPATCIMLTVHSSYSKISVSRATPHRCSLVVSAASLCSLRLFLPFFTLISLVVSPS